MQAPIARESADEASPQCNSASSDGSEIEYTKSTPSKGTNKLRVIHCLISVKVKLKEHWGVQRDISKNFVLVELNDLFTRILRHQEQLGYFNFFRTQLKKQKKQQNLTNRLKKNKKIDYAFIFIFML